MSESRLSINTIVSIGIGAAVFIILSRFGSIPTRFGRKISVQYILITPK